jgi:phenylalanine ammonia-lyase
MVLMKTPEGHLYLANLDPGNLPAGEPTPTPSPRLSLGPSPEPGWASDQALPPGSHTAIAVETWKTIERLRTTQQAPPSKQLQAGVALSGNDLDIASVVAVIQHGAPAMVDRTPELEARLEGSIRVLDRHLAKGWTVYGVNTGFGGSADVRTDTQSKDALRRLQLALLQHQQSGIIPSSERGNITGAAQTRDGNAPHTVPRAWVRAAMLVRANQNLRGQSAVRLCVIQRLLDMLEDDATPVLPLRGSVSASGDLQPLSYIAGALTGNPDIYVQLGEKNGGEIVSAAEYWVRRQAAGVPQPSLQLEPKEALGLINGTAPSAALASLVLHETQQLAVLAQMLTALTAEGLGANVEWTHDFVHKCRPHAGQREAAANMRLFLQGSQLVIGLGENRKRTGEGLWQDRYSTRTAAQWMGPYLEDLVLAQRQVEVELNSTSDNPLVLWDPETDDGDVFSGGNFQATSITSAMDKARQALQMIGRLLFSQVTELVNPATNNGLPANLSVAEMDDFAMKGVDINVAAYMSELASLAHPVSAHVLSAELGNQGVNSLAFITGRKTMEAVDLLAHICACHIFISCQAAELRVLNESFLSLALNQDARATFLELLDVQDNEDGGDNDAVDGFWAALSSSVRTAWNASNTLSWEERCRVAADAAVPPLIQFASEWAMPMSIATQFRQNFQDHLCKTMAEAGLAPISEPASLAGRVQSRLGAGTSQVHAWVRTQIGVPTHMGRAHDPVLTPGTGSKTVGSRISAIYESIRDGSLTGMVMKVAARDM